MRVPLEILQLILQEVVTCFSYEEILRSRLVCSESLSQVSPRAKEELTVEGIFNETLWPATAHLKNGKSLFTSWRTYPYKRKYLWYLVDEHPKRSCPFSDLIREILDLPTIAGMTDDAKGVLIEKMIDAATRSCCNPEVLFGLNYCRPVQTGPVYAGRLETMEETLALALAASAIRRGDHVELQTLLDQGNKPWEYSRRLAMVPVDLAYKEGTGEVIRTLVGHQCPLYYQNIWWPYHHTCGLVVAARRGKREVLEAWITALLQAGENINTELHSAVKGALRIGQVDMIGVLEKHLILPKPRWDRLWLDCLNEGVKSGMLDVVQWLFRHEGSSLASRTWPGYKAPLLIALHQCPTQEKKAMTDLLLRHGVDPDGPSGVSQTPLQRAVKDGEVEIARLLLEWGADPNTCAKGRPPLHLAAESGSAPLIQLLLEYGARRSYRIQGTRHVLRQERRVLENIARVMEDLGIDETVVRQQKFESFLIDQPESK